MSFYIYKAVDRRGKRKSGGAIALDQSEVLRDIKLQALFPVEIREVSEHEFYREKPAQAKPKPFEIFKRKKIGTKGLVLLLRDLASMIGAGLVITRALEVLKDQVHTPRMKELLVNMKEIVNRGQPLFV